MNIYEKYFQRKEKEKIALIIINLFTPSKVSPILIFI
jgi:hypothetical protein